MSAVKFRYHMEQTKPRVRQETTTTTPLNSILAILHVYTVGTARAVHARKNFRTPCGRAPPITIANRARLGSRLVGRKGKKSHQPSPIFFLTARLNPTCHRTCCELLRVKCVRARASADSTARRHRQAVRERDVRSKYVPHRARAPSHRSSGKESIRGCHRRRPISYVLGAGAPT